LEDLQVNFIPNKARLYRFLQIFVIFIHIMVSIYNKVQFGPFGIQYYNLQKLNIFTSRQKKTRTSPY